MKVMNNQEMEILRALYELRYLSVSQIGRLGYKERALRRVSQRLSRLRKDQVVDYVRLSATVNQGAWRLGRNGYRLLQEYRHGEFALGEKDRERRENKKGLALAPGKPWRGWDLVSVSENIDTSTAAGKMILSGRGKTRAAKP